MTSKNDPPLHYSRAGLAIGVVLLAALIVVIARKWTEGEHFAQLVRNARPAWILLAVALQAATYACSGHIWQLALARMQVRLSIREYFFFAVEKLFVDNVVPTTGVSGDMFVVRAISGRGATVAQGITAMIVNLLGSYIAFAGSVVASMIFLWVLHDVTAPIIIVTALFGFFSVCVPTGLVLIVRHRARFGDWFQKRAPRWLVRVPGLRTIVPELAEMDAEVVREPRLMVKVAAYELAVILLDSGTLWVLLMAIGVHVHVGRVFVAFVIALTAGTVSITPGGLATFEAACVAMLTTLGVGTEAALTGTLLLRGFTFWLPMVPGFWLVRKELAAETRSG